jgi:hypothetical protein
VILPLLIVAATFPNPSGGASGGRSNIETARDAATRSDPGERQGLQGRPSITAQPSDLAVNRRPEVSLRAPRRHFATVCTPTERIGSLRFFITRTRVFDW